MVAVLSLAPILAYTTYGPRASPDRLLHFITRQAEKTDCKQKLIASAYVGSSEVPTDRVTHSDELNPVSTLILWHSSCESFSPGKPLKIGLSKTISSKLCHAVSPLKYREITAVVDFLCCL